MDRPTLARLGVVYKLFAGSRGRLQGWFLNSCYPDCLTGIRLFSRTKIARNPYSSILDPFKGMLNSFKSHLTYFKLFFDGFTIFVEQLWFYFPVGCSVTHPHNSL